MTPTLRSRAARVRCLVVDDLEGNRVSLRALLDDGDVEVVCAASGAEALEHLLADEFALVLLDVHMPEMDGFEVAELMRGNARTRHVPIIFITASDADRGRVFQGYDAGAVDFLHKPVDADILRSKTAVFFELYRQRRQLAEDLRERSESLRLAEMFMAVLGHDLRSPLSSVLIGAQVLRDRPDADVAEVSGLILRGGERMQRMIDDLLDVTRLRLGQGLPLAPQACDLGVLAREVVRERGAAWPDRVVETTVAGDLAGRWDPERLRQVLSNLLGNALQHGAAGGRVELEIDGTAPETATIVVRNPGEIPDAVRASLFDPFRGADTARARRRARAGVLHRPADRPRARRAAGTGVGRGRRDPRARRAAARAALSARPVSGGASHAAARRDQSRCRRYWPFGSSGRPAPSSWSSEPSARSA